MGVIESLSNFNYVQAVFYSRLSWNQRELLATAVNHQVMLQTVCIAI